MIWTIGHSSRSWEEFLALLREQSIAALADVRRFAGSRRHPQFGPEQLPALLAAAGITYVLLPELGGRRKISADAPKTVWRNPSFQAYAEHMSSAEYHHGRERLLQQARVQRTAIMCSEAVWWRCHRALIADDLKASGVLVWHIMGPGQVVEHPFTSAAQLRDGKLSYRSAE